MSCQQWSCKDCTFAQPVTNPRCSMCYTTNPFYFGRRNGGSYHHNNGRGNVHGVDKSPRKMVTKPKEKYLHWSGRRTDCVTTQQVRDTYAVRSHDQPHRTRPEQNWANNANGEESKSETNAYHYNYNNNNISQYNGNRNYIKASRGSVYADCNGDCGSNLSKLIAVIIGDHVEEPLNTDDEKIETIDRYFMFSDFEMREYLARLMVIMKCSSSKEQQFIQQLKNKTVHMNTRFWLNEFVDMFHLFKSHPRKVLILQKMAHKACQCFPVIDVFHEVSRNLKTSEFDQKEIRKTIYNQLAKYRQHENYQVMVNEKQELTSNEMIALYLYTSSDKISHAFRKVYYQPNYGVSCEWRQTYANLGSAIKKLHLVFVAGKDPVLLPKRLYHGLPMPMAKNEQKLEFRTITSFSEKFGFAADFAKGGTIIKLNNVADALSNCDLIAASVQWLSPFAEYEWCLLPTDFTNIHEIKSKIPLAKMYSVTFKSCSLIPTDNINNYRMPVQTYLGDVDENEMKECVQYVLYLMVVVCAPAKIQCEHCRLFSRLVDFTGEFWESRLSCPCCRKYMLGAAQDEYEKVICYACGKETPKFKWKFPSNLRKQKYSNIKPDPNADDYFGVMCPTQGCHRQWKKTLRHFRMHSTCYRKEVRGHIRKWVKDTAIRENIADFSKRDIEQTVSHFVPELYDPNKCESDILQLLFKDDNLTFSEMLNAVLKSKFGQRYVIRKVLNKMDRHETALADNVVHFADGGIRGDTSDVIRSFASIAGGIFSLAESNK